MIKAFGYFKQGIFVVTSIYKQDILAHEMHLLGETTDIKEVYHVMFAERLIQHPAVNLILATDFTDLFTGRDI